MSAWNEFVIPASYTELLMLNLVRLKELGAEGPVKHSDIDAWCVRLPEGAPIPVWLAPFDVHADTITDASGRTWVSKRLHDQVVAEQERLVAAHHESVDQAVQAEREQIAKLVDAEYEGIRPYSDLPAAIERIAQDIRARGKP